MKKALSSVLAILLALAMLGMFAACGDKTEDPTEAPTTLEDITTTEEPTEPFEPDPAQSYWEQIESELAWYGLEGGFKVFNPESEYELMKKFSTNNTKKEELDVSGDGVPFSAAYRVTVAKDTEQFWNAAYSCNLEKDLEIEQDDLIVGVIWVRGVRLSETEKFMADAEPQYYLAMKTPTDEWATEGDMSPRGEQFAGEEWQKVFFSGRILNEESRSNDVRLEIFTGYGNQQLDIGGILAFSFPSTTENERAIWKFVGA